MKHILNLLAISVAILVSYLLVVAVFYKFIKNREIVVWCSIIALPLVVFFGFLIGIYTNMI